VQWFVRDRHLYGMSKVERKTSIKLLLEQLPTLDKENKINLILMFQTIFHQTEHFKVRIGEVFFPY